MIAEVSTLPLLYAVILLQDSKGCLVRQGVGLVSIDAFHRSGGDHGVDDGFFGGLDGGFEERVD